MKTLWTGLLATALLLSPASAQGVPSRPNYTFVRQNEDWSFLRARASAEQDGGADADWFDRWKYVPLNESGSVWASFGLQATSRFESWSNFAFDAGSDDTFVLTRVRGHADLHFGDQVRFFTELKTVQATDRDLPGGRRLLDLDTFDIAQAFLDVTHPVGSDSKLRVRTGRQMLQFGNQRLISPLPWANTLRAWDGLTAELRLPEWTVTAIGTAFVPIDKTDLNEANTDELLLGVYATRRPSANRSGLDVYLLGNTRENISTNGTEGDARRATLGARTWGTTEQALDWDVEADIQVGEIGDEDVRAWSFASQAGWKPCAPTRVWAGLDWASGDDSPGGSVQTFDQLYPLGHAYLGLADFIGRQNIIDLSAGAEWKPRHDLKLALGNHAFWTDSQNDAIYNPGGGVLRPGGSFSSSSVGFESDVTAAWRLDRHLALLLGYSRFFAGDALEESGPSDDVDFAYLQITATF